MFGPAVYEAFRQVKRGFDPENVLNPGKVVDAPAMEENLRVPPGRVARPTRRRCSTTRSRAGSSGASRLCNGAGVCRKTQGGAMCPSYRATRDERDTTRARANALRVALVASHQSFLESPRATTDGKEPATSSTALAERWIAEVMDLCLSCKACKTECPSNVDVAKLKAEFLHALLRAPAAAARPPAREEHPPPEPARGPVRRHRQLARAAAVRAPGDGELRRHRPPPQPAGVAPRPLPPVVLPANPERERRGGSASPRRSRSGFAPVVLLDDCFTTFQEPQHRPGRGRAAGAGRVHGRARRRVLRPGDDLEGVPHRRPPAREGGDREARRASPRPACRSSGWSRVAS